MTLDGFRDAFRDEAIELLSGLESTLLSLEETPEKHLVDAAFRSIHTIKGSAAMFGFEGVSRFAHSIESGLEIYRNRECIPGKETVAAVLACRDFILGFITEGKDLRYDTGSNDRMATDLLESLGQCVCRETGKEIAGSVKVGREQKRSGFSTSSSADSRRTMMDTAESEKPHKAVFRIRFVPKPDILVNGTNILALLRELSEAGDYSCIATEEIPPLSGMDPLRCYFKWDILLTTSMTPEKIREIFLFTEGRAEVRIELVTDSSDMDECAGTRRIGAILIERGASSPEQVEKAAGKQKKLGTLLAEDGVPYSEITAAVVEQEHVKRLREISRQESVTGSVRVGSKKLDDLVDLVGELVTVQARLTQTAGNLQDAVLAGIAEQVERLTGALRDSALGMRMMPIGATFSRFRRLVHDLARDLEKDVELFIEGGETELDKTVIEKLNDPLVHLIRNSLDHGLCTPEERAANGKPPTGRITLSARHSGGCVEVSVTDDGKGLDTKKIRETAIRKKLISPDTVLTDDEINRLIFLPGFSTASDITTVSGRGVGMDVVKRNLDALGGTITLRNDPGRGIEVLLRLPLTLAIIEGLLVDVSGTMFVIPLSSVEECIEFECDTDWDTGILNNRGLMLPYIVVSKFFDLPTGTGDFPQVVVVNTGRGHLGIVVDDVIGNHQTVIKNMGKMYSDIEGISGAAVLGDGNVAFIMDVQKLSATAIKDKTEMYLKRGRI